MAELIETGAGLPAENNAQLAQWAEIAREALSDNTLKAYEVDSRLFSEWAKAQGRTTLPASPGTVIEFIKSEQAKGLSLSTIQRRIATISRMHRAAALPNPTEDELVKLTVKGISKALGSDKKQAAPLTQRDTYSIKAFLGNTAKDKRDYALVLVGRDLLARSSELVSIKCSDIEFVEEGALISLRRRKTDTESHQYFIGPESTQALRGWLEVSRIDEGYVFCSLAKGGAITGNQLDTRSVRRIIKALAQKSFIDNAEAVSGHSLRVGMAQDLVSADLDVASVMQAGGWSTPTMVARYTEKITAQRGAVARFYKR